MQYNILIYNIINILITVRLIIVSSELSVTSCRMRFSLMYEFLELYCEPAEYQTDFTVINLS